MNRKSPLPSALSKSQAPTLELGGARSLTIKERRVLEFIEDYMMRQGQSPSYLEIKDFFAFASFNSVQNYLRQLAEKGYLIVPAHQKRGIQLLLPSNSFSTTGSSRAQLLQAREEILSVPLLGRVAAGLPLEKLIFDEHVDVPPSMVKYPSDTFALRVQGLSMIDEGILDGDIILVQKLATAQNGDLVVALIENEATVKRFFAHPRNPRLRRIELRPSNQEMESFWHASEDVNIEGRVVGLIRKF